MNRAQLLAQRRALLVIECALQRVTLVAQLQPSNSPSGWVSIALAAVDGFAELVPVRLISMAKIGLNLWKIWRVMFKKD